MEPENRKSHQNARKWILFDQKQIVALTMDNTTRSNKKEIINLVSKFYSDLHKGTDTLVTQQSIHQSHEDVSKVLVEEVEMVLKGMKNFHSIS